MGWKRKMVLGHTYFNKAAPKIPPTALSRTVGEKSAEGHDVFEKTCSSETPPS